MKPLKKKLAIPPQDSNEIQGTPIMLNWHPKVEEKDMVTMFSVSGIAQTGYGLHGDSQGI